MGRNPPVGASSDVSLRQTATPSLRLSHTSGMLWLALSQYRLPTLLHHHARNHTVGIALEFQLCIDGLVEKAVLGTGIDGRFALAGGAGQQTIGALAYSQDEVGRQRIAACVLRQFGW